MKASVIIVTLNRPDCVQRCLDCLLAQTRPAEQIIVVDASPDDLTRRVVANYPGVLYLRNDDGFGKMTASRNIGLRSALGEIIAFIDDDAFAHPRWLVELLAAYQTPDVGAVGGRVFGNPRETAPPPPEPIGGITSNGILTPYFWADPGNAIDVQHIMGCNMSFRREVVARLGGFREFLTGISGVAEDSDMSFRVRKLGYRIRFTPAAAVDHIGAPQAKGRRFDNRYAFFAGRNYTILLLKNYGLLSLMCWRYALYSNARNLLRLVKHPRDFTRTLSYAAGTLVGWTIAIRMLLVDGTDPLRHDSAGAELRKLLSRATASAELPMRTASTCRPRAHNPS